MHENDAVLSVKRIVSVFQNIESLPVFLTVVGYRIVLYPIANKLHSTPDCIIFRRFNDFYAIIINWLLISDYQEIITEAEGMVSG